MIKAFFREFFSILLSFVLMMAGGMAVFLPPTFMLWYARHNRPGPCLAIFAGWFFMLLIGLSIFSLTQKKGKQCPPTK